MTIVCKLRSDDLHFLFEVYKNSMDIKWIERDFKNMPRTDVDERREMKSFEFYDSKPSEHPAGINQAAIYERSDDFF